METPTLTRHRIASIDILRGLVMIIMALDHVRDYFHNDAFAHDPLNPVTTTVPLYFTRWVTHLCAPIFLFLSGLSAYIQGITKPKAVLGNFLIKRGLWLILMEVSIITLGWTFNPFFNVIILQVIWATGISMIFLGILVRYSYPLILVLGLIIACFHNLLDYPEANPNATFGIFWELLHHANNGRQFTMYQFAPNHFIAIIYAFLPWTGLMFLGYAMGKLYQPDVLPAVRKKKLLLIGSAMIMVFVVLRLINEYGDPFHWSTQRNTLSSFLSFMNVHKYPPSIMYACITIGPGILFLAISEEWTGKLSSIIRVYGSVPFFYYIAHIYLNHLFEVIAFFLSGYGAKDIVTPNFPFLFRPPQFGFDLWAVYCIWAFLIVVLYPLCKWYSQYKKTHSQWWLRYL